MFNLYISLFVYYNMMLIYYHFLAILYKHGLCIICILNYDTVWVICLNLNNVVGKRARLGNFERAG